MDAEGEGMKKLYRTPVVASIVMLFLALFEWPGGYYTLLRIIVCGTSIYSAFIAKGISKMRWVWVLGFIAILFNPLIPIHLDREMWGSIDVVVALTFITGIFALSGEGATKSLFQTKAFKIFRKIALIIIGCIFVIAIIWATILGIRNNIKMKSTQPDFANSIDVVEKESKHFDFTTARPVDGSFIETYSKGEVILIGNYKNGKADGIWKIYDKYGNLKVNKEYNNGFLADDTEFFSEIDLMRAA